MTPAGKAGATRRRLVASRNVCVGFVNPYFVTARASAAHGFATQQDMLLVSGPSGLSLLDSHHLRYFTRLMVCIATRS